VDSLKALVSLGSGLLLVVLTAVGWVVRRQGKEAREARKTAATAAAGLRLWRQMETLGAVKGWDQDPLWPKTPQEMTLEYLFDQAKEPGGYIAQLAKQAQEITKDKP
jgi:hypothetical protein